MSLAYPPSADLDTVAVTTTTVGPAKPLPATGSNGVSDMVAGSAILLIVGVAMTGVSVWRRAH